MKTVSLVVVSAFVVLVLLVAGAVAVFAEEEVVEVQEEGECDQEPWVDREKGVWYDCCGNEYPTCESRCAELCPCPEAVIVDNGELDNCRRELKSWQDRCIDGLCCERCKVASPCPDPCPPPAVHVESKTVEKVVYDSHPSILLLGGPRVDSDDGDLEIGDGYMAAAAYQSKETKRGFRWLIGAGYATIRDKHSHGEGHNSRTQNGGWDWDDERPDGPPRDPPLSGSRIWEWTETHDGFYVLGGVAIPLGHKRDGD